MKYINKFNKINENKSDFKITDEEIKEYFYDYIDFKKNCFEIKNGIIKEEPGGEISFINNTPYMKKGIKYKKAKLVKIMASKTNGISIDGEKCLTDIEVLLDIISDIKRFFIMSGENINFKINTTYTGLEVEFLIIGNEIEKSISKSDKIDEYLKRINDCIVKKGHKKGKINGNWLDFSIRNTYATGLFYKLKNIRDQNIIESTNPIDSELIKIRNEAWEDGIKWELISNDNQLVIKFINI